MCFFKLLLSETPQWESRGPSVWVTHFGLSLIHCHSWISPFYTEFNIEKRLKRELAKHIGRREMRSLTLTAAKTAGGEKRGKYPTSKHQILKSLHRVAKRRHAGKSVNMTEMIQSEKNKSLVLKVWQWLQVLSHPSHLCGLLCSPSKDEYHWFAHCNYSADSALIEKDVISRRSNKSIW